MEHRKRSKEARVSRPWAGGPGVALTLLFLSNSCGKFEQEPSELDGTSAREAVEIVVLSIAPDQPPGPDEPPRVELAQLKEDGSMTPLSGQYLAAEEFRRGAAAVTVARELHLVHPDGSHSVLARETDGLPARDVDGSLVFAARFGETVEIHRLNPDGKNRRLATFGGTATQLTPQTDGTVFFVGAASGGVAGLWVVDSGAARCVTNCNLRAGKQWGDAYQTPPRDLTTLQVSEDRVQWSTADGKTESASLYDKGAP